MQSKTFWTALPLAIGASIGAAVSFPGARPVAPLVVFAVVAIGSLLLRDA